MQKRTIAKIAVPVAIIGFFITYVGISNVAFALNPNRLALDAALGQIARAESAQTPQTPKEIIHYLTHAKAKLPDIGAIRWWSPDSADFKSIQAELDVIIGHAELIASLDPGNELYNSGLYDLHARLRVIQEALVAF